MIVPNTRGIVIALVFKPLEPSLPYRSAHTRRQEKKTFVCARQHDFLIKRTGMKLLIMRLQVKGVAETNGTRPWMEPTLPRETWELFLKVLHPSRLMLHTSCILAAFCALKLIAQLADIPSHGVIGGVRTHNTELAAA